MSENLQQLQTLTQNPAAVKWFDGLFRVARIEVTDTGEQFTLRNTGGAFEVIQGFDDDKPNFIMPLESQNIRNLVGFFDDNAINEHEEYRIVKFMLKPCLEAALTMPILQNAAFRKIVKVETHWQEALLDPQGKEDEQLTVIWVNDQWLVIPGYHGKPQRKVAITSAQALEFQRRVFEADEQNRLSTWLELGRWYLGFREDITLAAQSQ